MKKHETPTIGEPTKPGRPTVPAKERKQNKTVCLRPADQLLLEQRYGSIQGAINTLLVTPPNPDRLQEARTHLKAAQDALAVSGERNINPR